MDFITLVFGSFGLLFEPMNLAYVVAGFVIGTIFAAIPGLTATLAMALLLPLTYSLNVETALMACASIYMAGMCGGSITATTINIPGAPSSMMTALDGYPMQQQGKGSLALGHAALGSMFGGALGALLLIALAPFVAQLSLLVKTTGKFSLLAFALIVVVIAQRGRIPQAGLAACIGLMLATVGLDAMEPVTRFTYGYSNLTAGIALMPVIIGTFAIAEVLMQSSSSADISAVTANAAKSKIRRRDFLPPVVGYPPNRSRLLPEINAHRLLCRHVAGRRRIYGIVSGLHGSGAHLGRARKLWEGESERYRSIGKRQQCRVRRCYGADADIRYPGRSDHGHHARCPRDQRYSAGTATHG